MRDTTQAHLREQGGEIAAVRGCLQALAEPTAWASKQDVATPFLLTGEFMNYHGHGFLVLKSWRRVHTSDHLDN